MNELMLQLSELLELSVEATKEMYPLLRQQFVWYKSLEAINAVGSILLILMAVALVMGTVIYFTNLDSIDYNESVVDFLMKWRFKAVAGFVVGLVLVLVTYVLQIVTATDIMILLEATK